MAEEVAKVEISSPLLNASTVKEELGIDTDDPQVNNRLRRYIKVADAYLKGAIGKSYPKNDERAIELALLIIEDLYDRNSTVVKENSTIAKLKNDFMMQLRVEALDGSIQSQNSDTKT